MFGVSVGTDLMFRATLLATISINIVSNSNH
jgi:hypothetical protein